MSLLVMAISFFSLKNACAKKPCQNNSTCQAGFTDRDYQCLCISGFTGHDCEKGMYIYCIAMSGLTQLTKENFDLR